MNQNPQNAPPIYVINRENSGWAIASLVFGILGILGLDLCGGFIFTIAFGHIALAQIRNSNGNLGGRGMAIAGLLLGYIPLVIITVVLGFFLFAGISLSLAPKMDAGRREKERLTNIEKNRVQVPAEVLDSYAGDYHYQSIDKDYLIKVSVDGGNLRSQSPINTCMLLPQSNEIFAPTECTTAFIGTFIFRKNKKGDLELLVRYSDDAEIVCSKVR
jgi:hypothetical protein